MALNPFFLQGSQSEQRLVQDLINEQLKIYGIEVIYLPRRIVNKDSIFTEVQSSSFRDNFAIEAYVNTYEGYGGAGDIMTKFGMSLKDELTVTISKERFEDFISTFLADLPASEREIATRPCEGDLIFFPLGQRVLEIKFVEHEQPFYQLGKNYVYQLKCELFELEDELSNISGDALETITQDIDEEMDDFGYLTSLSVISAGSTAIVDKKLLIVIVGATVYPEPGLISNISLTENTSATDVVIATAEAFTPPAGAGVIETVGTFVYLNPSLVSSILRIYPETVLTPRLAVLPIETTDKLVI